MRPSYTRYTAAARAGTPARAYCTGLRRESFERAAGMNVELLPFSENQSH